MSLLIGRSWSWIGSCGGGGQESETSYAQGTCVLGIETFSSSVWEERTKCWGTIESS